MIIKKACKKLYTLYKHHKTEQRILREAPIAAQIFDMIRNRKSFDAIQQLASTIKSIEIKRFISRLSRIGYIQDIPHLTKPPTIAVVIPHYNHAHHIEEALTSLANQTVLPDEVIIIDDHSDSLHNIEYICQSYTKQLPITRIIPPQKLYLGKARQLGAEMATSDVIVMHDADDISHTQRIEITKHFFTQHPSALHLNIAAKSFKHTFLNYIRHFDMDEVQNCIVNTEQINAYMKQIFVEQRLCSFETRPIRWAVYGIESNNYSTIIGGHTAYRTTLARNIQWISPLDTNFSLYEDFDFSFMLLLAGQKSFVLDMPLAYYRQQSSSFILLKNMINKENHEANPKSCT